jgi:hypothetical protein
MSEGHFNVSDQQAIGRPDVQAAATMSVVLSIQGETIRFNDLPVRYKFNDQVRGELYEPLVVLPPYTVEASRDIKLVRGNERPVQEFTYTAQMALDSLRIYGDKGPLLQATSLRKGERRTYAGKGGDGAFSAVSTTATADFPYYQQPGAVTAKMLHTIRYEHIPHINYFTDASTRSVVLNVSTEGKRIGYIVGAGDKVPKALEQMGYEVTLLTEKEMERNNLKQFDAIMAGVRAFNANEWMGKYHDKLMQYVEDGGNYIVQYSQSNNIRAKIGPYNFNVVNKRVTNENAAVTFLAPEHPVLNFPNKITQDDFKGWVQERSIYHADNWDSRYQPVLRMNDPGEQPHDGSLIIAKHGKGYFAYTGLVFFRELPAGVPGAYRLLANLIALNKPKGM